MERISALNAANLRSSTSLDLYTVLAEVVTYGTLHRRFWARYASPSPNRRPILVCRRRIEVSLFPVAWK